MWRLFMRRNETRSRLYFSLNLTVRSWINANVSWSTASDSRLKHDVEEITYEEADAILKIKPVKFKWNATGEGDMGVIAQNVKEVIPSIVEEFRPHRASAQDHGSEETYYGLDKMKLIPLMIKQIQIQHEEIAHLREVVLAQNELLDRYVTKMDELLFSQLNGGSRTSNGS
jgi:hypothetical protein